MEDNADIVCSLREKLSKRLNDHSQDHSVPVLMEGISELVQEVEVTVQEVELIPTTIETSTGKYPSSILKIL